MIRQLLLPGHRLIILYLSLLPCLLKAESDDQSVPQIIDEHHEHWSRLVLRGAESINYRVMNLFRRDEEREAELITYFYGDRRSAYEVAGSHLRISARGVWSERSGHETRLRYSARLRLGDISDRLTLFADSHDASHYATDDIFSDRHRSTERDRRDDGTTAGLIYSLTQQARSDLSLSGGLRFRPEPSPRLRLRGRLRLPLGPWQLAPEQALFWDGQDGYGTRTQIKLHRPVGKIQDIDFSTSLVWSEVSQGLDWGQFGSWRAIISPRRNVAVRLGIQGHTHPSTVTDRFAIRIPYRQRIFRDWLFGTIEPGLDFAREHDYRTDPVIGLRLDVVVGAYDRLGF